MSGLNQQIRRVLLEGPATLEELALELESNTHRLAVNIGHMVTLGHVRKAGYRATCDRPKYGRPELTLWELTPRGAAWTKRKDRQGESHAARNL